VRALLVLDTVAAAEGSAEHFRELELELMPEMKEEKATALLVHLESLGVRRSDGIAKHVRALGARALVPLPWVIDQVKPGGTLAELVASTLSRSVQQLLHHDPRVFVGDDAEDVHQARVAVRRLRSDLQTFDVVLGKMPIAQLLDDLQPLAQALGALRDLDVLMGRLQGHLDALPTGLRDHADELQRRIERERERAREVLLELRSGAAFAVTLERLLREVPLLLHIPELQQPAEAAVGKVLERAWQPLREMVRRLPKQPRDNQLHRVRILAKRCRYAVEALTPLLPASANDFAHDVARLQTVLGDYHDAVVAQRYWERLARDGHKGMKALLEELRKQDHAQESALRVRWRGQWETLEGHPFLAEGAL
jgi:CHAD domain-containing protein